eukprot:TRINITY_DN7822_c0_g1_i1.p1 TRINITY_DN7822_c0_g1~~TRINITY_DN7822_c0_g1_i1.p1  ORF type:complete len:195 (-),score=37.60 TRINITY_DN7822_c0_g1_i1:49-594(-)
MGNASCCSCVDVVTSSSRNARPPLGRDMEFRYEPVPHDASPSSTRSSSPTPDGAAQELRNWRLRDMLHEGQAFRIETLSGGFDDVMLWVSETNTHLYWVGKTLGSVQDARRAAALDLRQVETIEAGGKLSSSKNLGITIVKKKQTGHEERPKSLYFECNEKYVRDRWVRGLNLACEECQSL